MAVSLYAGLLSIIYTFLLFLVITRRIKNRISLGEGEDSYLRPFIRAHANFVETVPFALFLIFLAEYQGVSLYVIHASGLLLLIGRVLHPIGILKHDYNAGKLRTIGMVMTLCAILLAAVNCLIVGFMAVFL